jgi:hypothetical protein
MSSLPDFTASVDVPSLLCCRSLVVPHQMTEDLMSKPPIASASGETCLRNAVCQISLGTSGAFRLMLYSAHCFAATDAIMHFAESRIVHLRVTYVDAIDESE